MQVGTGEEWGGAGVCNSLWGFVWWVQMSRLKFGLAAADCCWRCSSQLSARPREMVFCTSSERLMQGSCLYVPCLLNQMTNAALAPATLAERSTA